MVSVGLYCTLLVNLIAVIDEIMIYFNLKDAFFCNFPIKFINLLAGDVFSPCMQTL